MSCIDRATACQKAGNRLPHWALFVGVGLAALLGGCSNSPSLSKPGVAPVAPAPVKPETAPSNRGSGPAAPPAPPAPKAAGLAPPKQPKNHAELRVQAAQRLVEANPDLTYMGEVPSILLAIPVLEVELRYDGSIKNIHVLRRPGQAPETLQMAIDAVHRAAPFGNVSRLPEPWKFSETFLFNDQKRFKPRTLD